MRRRVWRKPHVFEEGAVPGPSRPAVLGKPRPHIPLFQGPGEWIPSVTRDKRPAPARTHLSEGLVRGLGAAAFTPAPWTVPYFPSAARFSCVKPQETQTPAGTPAEDGRQRPLIKFRPCVCEDGFAETQWERVAPLRENRRRRNLPLTRRANGALTCAARRPLPRWGEGIQRLFLAFAQQVLDHLHALRAVDPSFCLLQSFELQRHPMRLHPVGRGHQHLIGAGEARVSGKGGIRGRAETSSFSSPWSFPLRHAARRALRRLPRGP